MNRSPEKVFKYLTGNEDLDAVTVDDVKRLTDENPYFPVTQFLLARKLKDKNDTEYLQQIQKTALYFPNPYWLDYHLKKAILLAGETELEVTSTAENQQEKSLDNVLDSNEDAHVITSLFSSDELNAASALAHKTLEENPEINRATSSEVVQEFDEPDKDLTDAAEKEIVENEEEMAGVTHNSDKTTEQFLEEIEPPQESIGESGLEPAMQEDHHVDSDPSIDQNGKQAPDEHEQMFQNIKAMLDASAEEADADIENAVVPIDPYYTIDYFASQGIKLDLDPNPKDQLGQHLKKFTQWLKHMKKLGPEDATEVINRTETEADIQKIADSSNTAREVVTEAMALVLEKQGKNDKAIELYNKLSFLNPHKSAYFADKIKKLKGS